MKANPDKRILDIHQQKALLSKLQEKAIYTDEDNFSVEKMVVLDEKSLWLDNAEGFFAQIVEALPISVYVKDVQSNFTYINAKGREMLKFNEKLIIGELDTDVLSDKNASALFTRLDNQVRKEQKKHSISEEWKNELGEIVVNQTTRYPIVKIIDGNSISVGVASIADDLTWKQKALVGREIIHMITHDWITDLLKGFDSHIKKSSDKEIKERTEIFKFVMDYMDNLNIYYESNINAATFRNSLETCDLNTAVFRPMCRLMEYYYKKDKYRTIPIIENGRKKMTVTCNPIFLKILTYQQIKNHLRYGTSKTRLKIAVTYNHSNESYIIIFRSIGPQIPSEVVTKFKNPYYGYDETHNEGNGTHFQLGLFICKRIAQLHNGAFNYYYDKIMNENCFAFEMENLLNINI